MKLSVLVVDDSPVMRQMIIRTLRLCNLDLGQVMEAGNGYEALVKLKENPVDIMFLDVNMPVMDGLEMLERVRHDPTEKALPIFIISTESNEKRIEYIKSQDAEFLQKPFTPEDLKQKILQLLGTVKTL